MLIRDMEHIFQKDPNRTSWDENYNVWEKNTLDGINSSLDIAEENIKLNT